MNVIGSCIDFPIVKKEETNSQTTYYQQIKLHYIKKKNYEELLNLFPF